MSSDLESAAAGASAFAEAAAWFAATAAQVGDRWDDAGLGDWNVRDLIGHTTRALLTVETYLASAAGNVEVRSPEEYFARVLSGAGDPAAVAQRGRDAGAALGADPVDAVAAIADRVVRLVATAGPGAFVLTPAGGMLLSAYLPTRTFELVVHTCDLAVALGLEPAPPAAAAAVATRLLGDLAVATGRAGELLLAGTGRRPLPPGWSVLTVPARASEHRSPQHGGRR